MHNLRKKMRLSWILLPVKCSRETKPSLAAQCSLVETDMTSSWRNILVYPILGKYTLRWRHMNYVLNLKLLAIHVWHDFSCTFALLIFWFGEWDGLIHWNEKKQNRCVKISRYFSKTMKIKFCCKYTGADF